MADLNTCPPAQFLEALSRRHLEGKRVLIEDLGRHRTERSLEILIEIINADSWYLRDIAVDALALLGEMAVTPLTNQLHTGLWYTRAAAARALGKMGHGPCLAALVDLLGDPNHTVQAASLASIADLVRSGHAKEAARLFWNQGAARARELNRVLLAVHPDAGGMVADLLADPSSFLEEVRHTVNEEVEEPLARQKA